jgi:subtilisin family serine protease
MGMKWTTRLAAAAGVVALLAASSVTPALAEGTGEPFSAGLCQPMAPPETGSYDEQTGEPLTEAWQVTRLAPEKAWGLATGKGVKVAVIDTGVDNTDMEYFSAPRVKTFNYAPTDKRSPGANLLDCEHGTTVVSLLAASRSESSQANFSGIAPDVEVYAYRSLQLSKRENLDELEPLAPTIAAIRQAIAQRVDIINISQSAPSGDSQYEQAIADAIAAGIVVVAAAGNGGQSGKSFPAAYPGVIGVAMTNKADGADPQSQWGAEFEISVAAPGVEVLALVPSSKTYGLSYTTSITGTSYAAPLVTGVAALILQRYPGLTPAQVKQRLELSADPPAGSVPDPRLGYGIVNPYRALTMSIAGEQPTPRPGETVRPPLPADQRPRPDTTVRDAALVVATVAVSGTLLATIVRFSLPAARERRFRPAQAESSARPEKD